MKLSARNLSILGAFGIVTSLVGCVTNPDTRAGTEQELRTVSVTLSNFQRDPDMVHGFLQMRGLVPDAEIATQEIARALNGAP